jgi:hypothetical protein
MPDKRYLVWFSVPIVALLFALLWLVWLVALPWAANNNGFALPGSGGLPYRVVYAGRGYSNPATCARAGWCNNVPYGPLDPLCWQVRDIQGQHAWPLAQVGTMTELFGSPIPLLASRVGVVSGRNVTMVFVEMDNGCYVPYALDGS